MYSIKQSFADCSKCKLLDAPSCILETNCKDDLSKVDVIFIAENPGKDEVKNGVPLIGKAGQLFRKYFNQFGLNKLNYVLTNTVLCLTIKPDGTTGNPEEDEIERCKENCFQLIETCKPKLIVLLGSTPMSAFDISKSGITNLRGQIFKWRDYDVFLTVHPSYVNRNRSFEGKFAEDILKVAELLGEDIKNYKREKEIKYTEKGVHYYKIPEKFYTDEFRLVDIQFLNKTNEVLYIFRDKDNKRILHRENDDYVCYQAPDGVSTKKILPYDELYKVTVPYKQKTKLDPTKTYEGDIKVGVKHAIDYFIQNKGEALSDDMNVMFIDIEVYTDNDEFPQPVEAKHPIVILGYSYKGNKTIYAIEHSKIIKGSTQKIEKFDNANVIVCKTEKEILDRFIKDLKTLEPDIITGWHFIGFDLSYIYNRLSKVGLVPTSLSKFNEAHIDGETGYASVSGVVALDQLILYKEFTFGQKENYRLGTIAQIELGRDKLDEGETFNQMYTRDVNKAIRYNIGDVELVQELENKLKHINLQNELKMICKSTFRGSATPFGRIDALSISYLKEKGMSSRNTEQTSEDSKFEGAFVKEPIKGIHDWIVDFDFTSLYPSIILTYNIGTNTLAFKFKDTKYGYYFNYDKNKLPEKVRIILDPDHEKKEIEVTKEQLFKKVEEQQLISTISGCFFKQHEKELSFYSEILDMLLKSRKAFKKQMFEAMQEKNKNLEDLYNTRQMVYKILANAMYGVLGNNNFRFFNRDCARTITLSGQEAIKTSILEGNRFVAGLKSGKTEDLKSITVKEMYEDLDRKTPYVITGDTDSLFVTYGSLIKKSTPKEEAIEQVNKWNRQIEKYLNEDVIPQIVKTKNVDMKYNRLDLKNELIISRGLFLAKKRYSIHTIAQEGTPIDKIKSMGLEIKRSDFPSYTKKELESLLEIILKDEKLSLGKIQSYVKNKEKDFLERINKGDKTVGRPVSFTKKIKDYKTIPQGVIGMLNWNKLIYNIFTTGSRGYLFKIYGIDLDKAPKEVVKRYNEEILSKGGKLEVIVVPDEESRLPEYFVVDQKKMLDFSWTDRYGLLLEPIMEVKKQEEIITF